MATEKYANNLATTLTEDLDNSETGVDVASASGFTANMRILVDSEIMLVTSIASNTFTVTRGAEGTAAASHTNGTAVRHLLTKGALDTIIAENCQSVAYASLPAAEKAGRLILTTDSNRIFRDNGSAIEVYIGGVKGAVPPLSSAFTWDNQSVATIADNAGTLLLNSNCNASNSVSGMYKSAPATPYVLTVHFNPDFSDQNYSGYGLFWRQSSDGKIVTAQCYTLSNPVFAVRKWTTSTSFSASYSPPGDTYRAPQYPWMRLADNGTNRIVSTSMDGINWKQQHSIGRTDFLTANQIGFCILPELAGGGTATIQGFSIDSWLEA